MKLLMCLAVLFAISQALNVPRWRVVTVSELGSESRNFEPALQPRSPKGKGGSHGGDHSDDDNEDTGGSSGSGSGSNSGSGTDKPQCVKGGGKLNILCQSTEKICGGGCIPQSSVCCFTSSDYNPYYCPADGRCVSNRGSTAVKCCPPLSQDIDCDATSSTATSPKAGEHRYCPDDINNSAVPRPFSSMNGFCAAGLALLLLLQ